MIRITRSLLQELLRLGAIDGVHGGGLIADAGGVLVARSAREQGASCWRTAPTAEDVPPVPPQATVCIAIVANEAGRFEAVGWRRGDDGRWRPAAIEMVEPDDDR